MKLTVLMTIAMLAASTTTTAAHPKLNRGNCIAANVLADNLGAHHPGITTQATPQRSQ